MMGSSNFRVIAADVHGASVRCSFCTRAVPCVVALPLKAADDDAWIGLCAYCVLAMAQALAANSNEEP